VGDNTEIYQKWMNDYEEYKERMSAQGKDDINQNDFFNDYQFSHSTQDDQSAIINDNEETIEFIDS